MDRGRPTQLTFHPDCEPTARWQIGEVRVTRVVEGLSEFPRRFLPALSDERIARCQPWAEPYLVADHRHLLLSTHSFVVETPDHLVVVDTCVGPHEQRRMGSDHAFEQRLIDALPGGLEAVDVVICTHLHMDHVGWNTRREGDRLVPTFPNARYLVTDAELRSVQEHDPMAVLEPSVLPLIEAGLVDAVDGDHRVDDHVRLRPSAGHSPGHVCVVIESAGARALITGDAVHSPMQFAFPDVTAERADSDSPMAIRTREGLVAELVDSDVLVLGTHFPTPTAGRVRGTGGATWFDTTTR